jgi:hypothetical protein
VAAAPARADSAIVSEAAVRVLVVDIPPLTWDLLQAALAQAPGLNVVGRTSLDELAAAVDAGDVDVALVGLGPDGWPPACERMLEERARPRLLGIGWEDGEAQSYALRPDRSRLGPLTPGEVARVLEEAE